MLIRAPNIKKEVSKNSREHATSNVIWCPLLWDAIQTGNAVFSNAKITVVKRKVLFDAALYPHLSKTFFKDLFFKVFPNITKLNATVDSISSFSKSLIERPFPDYIGDENLITQLKTQIKIGRNALISLINLPEARHFGEIYICYASQGKTSSTIDPYNDSIA